MPSSVFLSYNGFSGFQHVRVARMEHLPDASPEKGSRGVTRHRIEGDAIIKGTGSNLLSTVLPDLTARLNRNGMPLLIKVIGPSGGSSDHVIVDVAEGDDRTGPYPEVRIVEIVGTDTAIVQWSFEWFRIYSQSGGPLARVREFVMQASFTVDEIGMTRIDKRGYITLAKSGSNPTTPPSLAPASSLGALATPPPTGYQNAVSTRDRIVDYQNVATGGNDPTAAYPDEYRRLVCGYLLPGFRRTEQRYMVDESRTTMAFQIVEQEFARGLPSPARRARVDFSFERQILADTGDNNAMGIKRFTAEIEGHNGTSPADLLALAVRLSQNRIVWATTATANADMIRRMAVHEIDMTNRNAIALEIEAMASSTINLQNPADNTPTAFASNTTNMLKDILSAISLAPTGGGETISFTFTQATQPDAYGQFGVYRITPAWYDPELAVANRNWNTARIIAASEKQDAVYEFPQAVFTSIVMDAVKHHVGRDRKKLRKDQTVPANPYLTLKSAEVYESVTNAIVAPSCDLTGADKVFQIGKPTVVVRQRVAATRMNAAPEREFLARGSQGVTIDESFRVHGGMADVNGNRIMAAVFERTYRCRDGGGASSNGFSTVTSGGNSYRQFWPQSSGEDSGYIALPKLATRDSATVAGDELFRTNVGTAEAYA